MARKKHADGDTSPNDRSFDDLTLSSDSKNIVVIGDLIIDHAIFVEGIDPRKVSHVQDEQPYRVIRRQNTAGGAANTARLLVTLYPEGTTYLWGLLGESPWGRFRDILENNLIQDGAQRTIEFRGVHDESAGMMNTITRLVTNSSVQTRFLRYDDTGYIHIPEYKRNSLLHHLKRIHAKTKIHAIVVNDLDKGCIGSEQMKKISKFACDEEIPLFIDPKRDGSKYGHIKALAITPNIYEWISLVGIEKGNDYDPDMRTVDWWRKNLNNKKVLRMIVERTMYSMPDIKYHIIKFDKDGAIIIEPGDSDVFTYYVYYYKHVSPGTLIVKEQLGPGDVMIGVLAAEYDTDKKDIITPFIKANIAVASYRGMPYQRMPKREAVLVDIQQYNKTANRNSTPIYKGTVVSIVLPKKETISINEISTIVPGIISMNEEFRNTIKSVMDNVFTNCGSRDDEYHLVLGAPSGTGKSEIKEHIIKKAQTNYDVHAIKQVLNASDTYNHEYFTSLRDNACTDPRQELLVIVDEALKKPSNDVTCNKDKMVVLLNEAREHNVRFMFIDAKYYIEAFYPTGEEESWKDPEIMSRMKSYYLHSVAMRPFDVPYIIAYLMWKLCNRSISKIRLDRQVLVTILNKLISMNPATGRAIGPIVRDFMEANDNDTDGTRMISIIPQKYARFKEVSYVGSKEYNVIP